MRIRVLSLVNESSKDLEIILDWHMNISIKMIMNVYKAVNWNM